MIDVMLSRIVLRDDAHQQYIYLTEVEGKRTFQIVIGNNEAEEIHRVVHAVESKRPFTHQLTHSVIEGLGAHIDAVEIVDLKLNTFFARILLTDKAKQSVELDARPSDAIALALRAGCTIRVAEKVLAKATRSSDN
jgi:bifunctional DNase/RNase